GEDGLGGPDRREGGGGGGDEAAGGQAVEGLVDGQGVGPGQERALVVGARDAAADRVQGREGVLDQADDRQSEPLAELAQGRFEGRRRPGPGRPAPRSTQPPAAPPPSASHTKALPKGGAARPWRRSSRRTPRSSSSPPTARQAAAPRAPRPREGTV